MAEFDGSDPTKPVLVGYRGYVYAVSGRFTWMNGRHFRPRAGRDLTERMREAPRGEEMLEAVPRVSALLTGDDDGKDDV